MGDDGGAGCLFAIFVVACAVAFFFGLYAGTSFEQRRAIEAGVGRWTVDGKTGERAFVYGEKR